VQTARVPRPNSNGWFPPDAAIYAYLLGMYLGDGCLSSRPRGNPFLQVRLDGAYPGIVAECRAALERLVEDLPVHVYHSTHERTVTVQATYVDWLRVFPQHGPGRKHERRIALWPWQRVVLDRAPGAFLRGLIHSDGCRTVNRFDVALPSGRIGSYAYPRYFFSNESGDIRALFCVYCDKLDIRWTQSNRRNVSVSHRHSVARLDALVGPKA
jgi:hypothetical protein